MLTRLLRSAMLLIFLLGSNEPLVAGMKDQVVLSGTWVGGGGELFGDEKNPWFISLDRFMPNFVSYCILVDEENFGVSYGTLFSLGF